MHWSDPLTDPITLRDGRVLVTLRDAAELLTNFHEMIQGRAWNQSAAELLMTAAEAGKTKRSNPQQCKCKGR
jgi:hypothetical protein